MSTNKKELLKNLPKVDKIFIDPRLKSIIARYPKKLVMREIREYLKGIRSAILTDDTIDAIPDFDSLVQGFVDHAHDKLQNSLKRSVNGMGIILHTNLGRAPFPEDAQRALMDVVAHYCNIQISQDTGKRGNRHKHVEDLLCEITGAEAALIVNNNCAATLLVLNTLAKGKEVITSRGELVEIGGSFRIPSVMKQSGAILREVGTTNRTHLKDYQEALCEETGLVLQVHMSNYAIIGFTKVVPIEELVDFAHSNGLPMFHDLGSGALVDFSRWGLPKEPTVQDSVKEGADVTCFSGDKLIGGPQCGIIVGKKESIDKMKNNQLCRALRCDKMTYTVLETTLRLFMDERKLKSTHPVIRMLTESAEDVKKRCMSLKRRIKVTVGDKVKLRVIEDISEVGSGSMSMEKLKSWALSIRPTDRSLEELASQLRLCNPPIFGRVHEDRYLLNLRTIREDEVKFILQAFEKVFKGKK